MAHALHREAVQLKNIVNDCYVCLWSMTDMCLYCIHPIFIDHLPYLSECTDSLIIYSVL